MAKRTKQPEGCIGISEKCVFQEELSVKVVLKSSL